MFRLIFLLVLLCLQVTVGKATGHQLMEDLRWLRVISMPEMVFFIFLLQLTDWRKNLLQKILTNVSENIP